MRGVVVLALLGGCGRFGFDPSAAGDGGSTVKPDGAALVDGDPLVDSPIGFGSYTVVDTTVPYASPAGAQPIAGFTADADDDNFALPLPFTFVFFGIPYTSVTASVNGFLTFGVPPVGVDSYENECPFDTTAPDATIAVFWDDLVASQLGTPAMATATLGTAPDRAFVVEWRDLDAFYRAGSGNNSFSQGILVTQQVVLHESGAIDLHYGPRTAPAQDKDCGLARHEGCSASVGIEAPGSPIATPIQCGTALGPQAGFAPLVDGRKITLTPN